MNVYIKSLFFAIPIFIILISIEMIFARIKGIKINNGADMISSLSSGLSNTIKDAISAFMSNHSSEEAEKMLESVGIPISRVLTVQEMVELPHIKDRGLYPTVDHPKAGPVKITGTAYAGLSKTPGTVFSHPPMANEHGPLVLERVLGYRQDQIKEMEDDGVFSV